MMYIQVLAGFVILVLGAEFLVRGAVNLADRLGIPPIVVGMTVVAIGTSAPELVVSLKATFAGSPGLALGNLVGSNIANVLLILGATCVLKPIVVHSGSTTMDGYVFIGGSIIFTGLCLNGELSVVAGVILLVAFFMFLGATYWRDTHDPEAAAELVEEVEELRGDSKPMALSFALVVAGIVGLIAGADLLVEGGTEIARAFGVSEEVIGLTLFALGTSLPELAASIVAAYRGHPAVAIGNVVGSNMFNILGVGGVIASVATIPVAAQIAQFDVWVMLGSAVLLLPVLVFAWRITRFSGAMLLVAYGGYVWIQAIGVDKVLASIG
jgi:cation:H+ antiporter